MMSIKSNRVGDKRMNLTVSPQQDKELNELCDYYDVSKSELVRQLVHKAHLLMKKEQNDE